MEIELESFVITIVFTCVPQTLIHPLAHCRWRKQRGSRNNCKKLVFHRCETYLNFVIHQLESSQLCPNLVLHTLIQPLKIADRRYFAKTFTTIFSCASFPNPGLLGHRGWSASVSRSWLVLVAGASCAKKIGGKSLSDLESSLEQAIDKLGFINTYLIKVYWYCSSLVPWWRMCCFSS